MVVQRQSMRQECIAIGMGMYEDPGAPEEMQLVFREVIKDGCTVIAVDRSDRVVAVAFNKLHASIALHQSYTQVTHKYSFTLTLDQFRLESRIFRCCHLQCID